jgi:hypothetical protein
LVFDDLDAWDTDEIDEPPWPVEVAEHDNRYVFVEVTT